jgi:hypothetical protein
MSFAPTEKTVNQRRPQRPPGVAAVLHSTLSQSLMMPQVGASRERTMGATRTDRRSTMRATAASAQCAVRCRGTGTPWRPVRSEPAGDAGRVLDEADVGVAGTVPGWRPRSLTGSSTSYPAFPLDVVAGLVLRCGVKQMEAQSSWGDMQMVGKATELKRQRLLPSSDDEV